jgi:hypothetical protein
MFVALGDQFGRAGSLSAGQGSGCGKENTSASSEKANSRFHVHPLTIGNNTKNI